MPWVIQGDLSINVPTDEGGYRYVQFLNSDPSAVISEVNIVQYHNDNFYNLNAILRNAIPTLLQANLRRFEAEIGRRGMSRQGFTSYTTFSLEFVDSNDHRLFAVLEAITAVEPSFAEMQPQVFDQIRRSVSSPSGARATSPQSPRPSSPLPPPVSATPPAARASPQSPRGSGRTSPAPAFMPGERIARGATIAVPSADEECGICQDSFGAQSVAVKTNCGHYFHNNCILRWQETTRDVYDYQSPLAPGDLSFTVSLSFNKCPICRRILF